MKKPIVIILLIASIPFLSTAQHLPLRLYNADNQIWKPQPNQQYYVIKKNSKNCLNCFPLLYELLKKRVHQELIFCWVSIDSNAYSRRKEKSEISSLMPGINILFEYTPERARKTSLFYDNKVEITPTLTVISKKGLQYYRYEEIFSGTSLKKSFLTKLK